VHLATVAVVVVMTTVAVVFDVIYAPTEPSLEVAPVTLATFSYTVTVNFDL